MKKTALFITLGLFSFSAWSQGLSGPPSGDNEKAKVVQWIGPVEVAISYSSPDVHASNGDDRKGHIWGELVHAGFADQGYGVKSAPWRAGANENTVVSFSHDVKVGGKPLKAGAYALFLDYEKSGASNWIFSTNTASWGSYYYNPAEDALRVPSTPVDAPYTEWLTFGFENRLPNLATAYLQWENKKFPFTIEVPNVDEVYVGIIRNELRGVQGFDVANYRTAAQFCADKKINLPEALTWADNAMSPALGGKESFDGLQTKAAVLNAMGKTSEADAVLDKAIKLPDASVMAIHQYGKTLLAAGKKEKAIEIFKYNQKTHPNDKFITNVGLARAYTATGDKANAIKSWDVAIKNIPEDQKPNLAKYQEEREALKK